MHTPAHVQSNRYACITIDMVTDPCCVSGGMFVQSIELVKARQDDINRINVYGQKTEPATYRLVKMNLALRGISQIVRCDTKYRNFISIIFILYCKHMLLCFRIFGFEF